MGSLFAQEQFEPIATRQRGKTARGISAVLLVPLALIVAVLWLIWERTPDVPVADEYQLVDLVSHAQGGTLRLTDFWWDWNGHRIVTTRLVELPLIALTHYNRQVMMSVNLLVVGASLLLLFACIRRTARSATVAMVAIVPLSLLLFSLGQYENWLNPFQLPFLATVLGVAIAMWGITGASPSTRGLLLAILGALIASFSSLAGLTVWIVFLPVLWLSGYRRLQHSLLWLAVASLVIAPYRIGLSEQPAIPHALPGLIGYFLAFVGAPLASPSVPRAQLYALIGLSAFTANVALGIVLARGARRIAVWIGLALFALAAAAETAIGRLQFGVGQAEQSRYQAFSVLFWVAAMVVALLTIQLLVQRFRRQAGDRRVALGWGAATVNVIGVGLLCIALLQQNTSGFAAGRTWLDGLRANQECVFNYETATDACLRPFLPPSVLRGYAAYLDRHDLALFYRRHPIALAHLPQMPGVARYALDQVNGVAVGATVHPPVVAPFGAPLDLSGWAVDAGENRVAGAVYVVIDGVRTTRADYGADRPDVAAAYATPTYEKSGFHAVIPPTDLPIGTHAVTLNIVTSDLHSYFATAPLTVAIQSPTAFPRIPDATQFSVFVAGIEQRPPDQTKPIAIPTKSPVIVSGWAVDQPRDGPAAGVVIAIDSTTEFAADYGADRPDVAAFFGKPSWARTGFVVSIPPTLLGSGSHTVTMRILASDGHAYYEPPWQTIVVIP